MRRRRCRVRKRLLLRSWGAEHSVRCDAGARGSAPGRVFSLARPRRDSARQPTHFLPPESGQRPPPDTAVCRGCASTNCSAVLASWGLAPKLVPSRGHSNSGGSTAAARRQPQAAALLDASNGGPSKPEARFASGSMGFAALGQRSRLNAAVHRAPGHPRASAAKPRTANANAERRAQRSRPIQPHASPGPPGDPWRPPGAGAKRLGGPITPSCS
jgi:hypothetical protein